MRAAGWDAEGASKELTSSGPMGSAGGVLYHVAGSEAAANGQGKPTITSQRALHSRRAGRAQPRERRERA